MIIFFILAAGMAFCQDKDLSSTHEFMVSSTELNENRIMSVSLPDHYSDRTDNFPVLYVLDGETHFKHACGAVSYLSENGFMPEMIVVALINVDRNRDFSPVHVDNIATSGGADTFLDFISEELIPYVNKNYRTSGYDVLVGHSFGGVFATYTLLEKPELFDAYISISPFLQFADNHMVHEVEKKLALMKTPVSFYMSIGNEPNYFEALEKTAELIRAKQDPNFNFTYEFIGTENHMSNPYISVYKGLRFIFDDWQVPDETADRGLFAIKHYYQQLSLKYGVHAVPPENTLNNLGYAYLTEKEIEKAIAVFEANIDYHPDSPNVYDSLGEALETDGKIKQAKKNYKKAWDLGQEQAHPLTEIFKQNYERVK